MFSTLQLPNRDPITIACKFCGRHYEPGGYYTGDWKSCIRCQHKARDCNEAEQKEAESGD